jgi:hypothetical protein
MIYTLVLSLWHAIDFQVVSEYISVWEIEINDRGDPLRWPRNTIYPQKLALLRQEAAVARSA